MEDGSLADEAELAEHSASVRPTDSIDWAVLSQRKSFWSYVGIHLGATAILWVGWSPAAVLIALAIYGVRMFAITGFFHRYFSHRTFETSRPMAFLFGWIGAASGQKGPLWWAAHHRHHHRHSDQREDVHSPRQHGFWWSHLGWFWISASRRTKAKLIPDLTRFPELLWLDRYHGIPVLLLALSTYGLGEGLAVVAPSLGTNGPQLLVWGFFVSTVALYHATYSINSIAHRFGTRRFETKDDSRNNLVLALATMGEGWHNNHHRYPGSARQGIRWYEIDATFGILWFFERVGLVRNLRAAPNRVREPGSGDGQRPARRSRSPKSSNTVA